MCFVRLLLPLSLRLGICRVDEFELAAPWQRSTRRQRLSGVTAGDDIHTPLCTEMRLVPAERSKCDDFVMLGSQWSEKVITSCVAFLFQSFSLK